MDDDLVTCVFVTVMWASIIAPDGRRIESGFVTDEDQLKAACVRNGTCVAMTELCMN